MNNHKTFMENVIIFLRSNEACNDFLKQIFSGTNMLVCSC